MSHTPGITIQAAPGRIVLGARLLLQDGSWQRSKMLLERLLSIPSVALVRIDRLNGQAEIRLDPLRDPARQVPVVLREIADALRTEPIASPIHDRYQFCATFGISKLDGEYVGGEVLWVRSGQTCLSHPLLQGRSGLSLVVKRMLEWQPQISNVQILSNQSGIVVCHDTDLDAEELLVILEAIVGKIGEVAPINNSDQRLLVSAGCVALAVPAELMLPAAIPAVAAMLVLANFKTLSRGAWQLIALRWRLPALYTVIMATTLISGQVLAAAVMQASIAAWYCWSNRRLNQLLERLLATSGNPVDQRPEPRPILIDNRPAQTLDGSSNNQHTSHTARLGARFQEGLLKSLARISAHQNSAERCHDQASRFIPFTFATGAAAIATTDISTLAAVLRPDYSTGPSISEQIQMIAQMGDLIQHGWLVTHPDAMARFVIAEKIVIFHASDEDHPPSTVTLTKSSTGRNLDVTFESWKLPQANVSIDVEIVTGPSAACSSYARQIAEQRNAVVFCGPAEVIQSIENPGAIRILTETTDSDPAEAQADFVMLARNSSLRSLIDVILGGTQRTRNGWSIVLTCNFASVLGAFIVGLTSLHVVALTNLGTWAAFAATSGYDIRRKLAHDRSTQNQSAEIDLEARFPASNSNENSNMSQTRLPV